jgi:hypothetical protein
MFGKLLVRQFLPHLKKQLPEGCAVIDDSTLQGPIAATLHPLQTVAAPGRCRMTVHVDLLVLLVTDCARSRHQAPRKIAVTIPPITTPPRSRCGFRLRPREVLRVGLAGAAEMEHSSTEQGDHISGAFLVDPSKNASAHWRARVTIARGSS